MLFVFGMRLEHQQHQVHHFQDQRHTLISQSQSLLVLQKLRIDPQAPIAQGG